jgi:cytochrome c oxidase cbb3-type subunit 3
MFLVVAAPFAQVIAGADPGTWDSSQRNLDKPAMVASGKALYSVNCSFCHGAGATGGESAPNLLRSKVVQADKDGELITAVIQNGILDKGMPKFSLDASQRGDIAAYIHSLLASEVTSHGQLSTVSSLVGDAKRGRVYFNGRGHCASCHSIDADLRGIGSKYEPRDLQVAILTGGRRMPPGVAAHFAAPASVAPGTTATITLPNGTIYRGKLDRIDEFAVEITPSDTDDSMTFSRHGDTPRVEVSDPFKAHRELLRHLEDVDIQNLTAYLATIK